MKSGWFIKLAAGREGIFMQKWFTHNQKGYTLIEMLTAIFITSMVLGLLVTSLQFSCRLTEGISCKTISGQESKRAYLFIQKQLAKSQKIFVKDGRVYLQDMETPDYCDFYTLEGGAMVYRNKVHKDTLKPIEKGGKSQLIHRVTRFELRLEEMDTLQMTLEFSGDEPAVNARFYYPNEVEKR